MGICTHTAHPKSASTKKAEKQQKSRIFDQNFKSAIWVFLPFPNIFRTFFRKTNDLNAFWSKKNFSSNSPKLGYFKAKYAKNGDFRPKMAMARNFCGRNCGLWGRGGRKKFGPHQKYPKVPPKKFWGRGPYLGTL